MGLSNKESSWTLSKEAFRKNAYNDPVKFANTSTKSDKTSLEPFIKVGCFQCLQDAELEESSSSLNCLNKFNSIPFLKKKKEISFG